MKKLKKNWKRLTIAKIMENKQLFGVETQQEAISLQSKLYQQAIRRIRKQYRGELNVTREVYAAMFYSNKANLFQVSSDNKSIQLNTIYQTSSNLSISMGIARMTEFFTKYSDDPQLMQIKYLYESSQISRQDFNELIKDWKRKNQKYMFSGSR